MSPQAEKPDFIKAWEVRCFMSPERVAELRREREAMEALVMAVLCLHGVIVFAVLSVVTEGLEWMAYALAAGGCLAGMVRGFMYPGIFHREGAKDAKEEGGKDE